MKFKEAFDLMVRDGKNIKRKSWKGFWYWADGTIWITTREGDTIDIRATTDVSYTIRNTFADDWELVDERTESGWFCISGGHVGAGDDGKWFFYNESKISK